MHHIFPSSENKSSRNEGSRKVAAYDRGGRRVTMATSEILSGTGENFAIWKSQVRIFERRWRKLERRERWEGGREERSTETY